VASCVAHAVADAATWNHFRGIHPSAIPPPNAAEGSVPASVVAKGIA
jgi:hypothetical protein